MSGNLKNILERCHDTNSIVWRTKRKNENGHIIFVPRGTDCINEDLETISATQIREIVFKQLHADEAFRNKLDSMLLNTDLLIIYMNLDPVWMEQVVWAEGKWMYFHNREGTDDIELDRKIALIPSRKRSKSI